MGCRRANHVDALAEGFCSRAPPQGNIVELTPGLVTPLVAVLHRSWSLLLQRSWTGSALFPASDPSEHRAPVVLPGEARRSAALRLLEEGWLSADVYWVVDHAGG